MNTCIQIWGHRIGVGEGDSIAKPNPAIYVLMMTVWKACGESIIPVVFHMFLPCKYVLFYEHCACLTAFFY